MSEDSDNKELEVSLPVLAVIREAAIPLSYRLDCLLEDHYNGKRIQSKLDLMALLEYRASVQTLDVLLEQYLEPYLEDEIADQAKISIPLTHFKLITTTSRTIEVAFRSLIGNVPLWTH